MCHEMSFLFLALMT